MDRNWLLKHLHPEKGQKHRHTPYTCSPRRMAGSGGQEGARQIAVCQRMEHSAVMLFFSICFCCGGRVRVWRTWLHTVFVCTLREARIICMVCYKLSRAAIACQNSSTCVCVSDCGSVGISLGLHHPLTHTHSSSLKYEKKQIIQI